MQRLEVSGVVRLTYRSLGVKGLNMLSFEEVISISSLRPSSSSHSCSSFCAGIYLEP